MNQSSTTPSGVEQGWMDGAPLSLPTEVLIIDLVSYRRLTCEGCGKRGMKAVPQRNGQRYRVLCSCRTCRHVEVC